MICTEALRQDTNNMWRGLSNPLNIPYDASPTNAVPGTHGVALATVLNSTTPWTSTPTHWLASAWELPTFADLLASLKAGNITSRDWAPFNLNQQRARTAGQSIYSRTVDWTGLETDPDASEQRRLIVRGNLAAALTELGLFQIPDKPTLIP